MPERRGHLVQLGRSYGATIITKIIKSRNASTSPRRQDRFYSLQGELVMCGYNPFWIIESILDQEYEEEYLNNTQEDKGVVTND